MLLIDVDHFKRINDHHGHLVGDEVIRRVGAIIRRCLATAIWTGATAATNSVSCCPGRTARPQRPRPNASAPESPARRFEQASLCCTLSIGLAEVRPDTRDVRAWIQQADAAPYHAKLEGRNRLAVAAAQTEPAEAVVPGG